MAPSGFLRIHSRPFSDYSLFSDYPWAQWLIFVAFGLFQQDPGESTGQVRMNMTGCEFGSPEIPKRIRIGIWTTAAAAAAKSSLNASVIKGV